MHAERAPVLWRAAVDDARLVEMDVRLDQAGTAQAPARVMLGSVSDKLVLDRRDTPIRDADVHRLARAVGEPRVADDEVEHLKGELNAMLAFVEQLSEVNVEGVEPMTSVTPMEMKKRPDVVNDGEIPDDIVGNAPETQNHFFLVPKVVE